jgi:hypothetical protein
MEWLKLETSTSCLPCTYYLGPITMANASTKRIAASNEQALRNLQLGLLIVNVSPSRVPTTRGVLMNSLEHGYYDS